MEPAELVLLLLLMMMEVSGRELRAADMVAHGGSLSVGKCPCLNVERESTHAGCKKSLELVVAKGSGHLAWDI